MALASDHSILLPSAHIMTSNFRPTPTSSERVTDGADSRMEPAGASDLRAGLLRWYLLFAGSLLILLLAGGFYARRQAQAAIVMGDLALAHAFAEQFETIRITAGIATDSTATESDNESLWLIDPAYSALIIDANGQIAQFVNLPAVATSASGEHWLKRVAKATQQGNEATFSTIAPEGVAWRHTRAELPSGDGWVVLLRAETEGLAHVIWPAFAPFLAAAFALFAGLLFWIFMLHRYITPLERLIDLSEVIRWRGHLRPAERRQLAQLTGEPGQVGRLAQSLTALEEETRDRFLQLTTLLQTSRAVAASLDTAQVLDSILVQVQSLFDVDKSAVLTLDERAGVFRMRASRSLSSNYVHQMRVDPNEPNSMSMRALRNRTPVQVSDTETDLAFAQFRQRARDEGFRSVLAIPLQTHHAQPAVLVLYKEQPHRYSFGELELASSFAAHVSVALENAALYARSDTQLQEQTRRLEAIVESLSDGLVLESLSGAVLYCNRRAATMLGLRVQQMRELDTVALLGYLLENVDGRALVERQIARVLSARKEAGFDLTRRVGGRVQDLRIHFFNVTDARGQQLGRGQLWQDVTADKELDRMKSSLISTVSHELRTPLATIKGYASTLLAPDVDWDPDSQREFLEIISNETDRLTDLVKNLLDLSRIEAGNLDIQPDLYVFNRVVEETINGFDDSVRQRLRPDLASGLPLVRMDAARIGTVIRNLIENGVKYSPADTLIDITTSAHDGQVIVRVHDHGYGIPDELGDLVFERFFRGDEGLTRQTGGVGLGLSICKGFVEAHDGRIWLEAADSGPGTVVNFSLPVRGEAIQEIGEMMMEYADVAG